MQDARCKIRFLALSIFGLNPVTVTIAYRTPIERLSNAHHISLKFKMQNARLSYMYDTYLLWATAQF